jgi:hypothetical protein
MDFDPYETSEIKINDDNFSYNVFLKGGFNYGNGNKIYPHFLS